MKYKFYLGLTGKNPQLEIVEEPVDMFRFRYKSEMGVTHGSLIGRNSHINKNKKTFPSVKVLKQMKFLYLNEGGCGFEF